MDLKTRIRIFQFLAKFECQTQILSILKAEKCHYIPKPDAIKEVYEKDHNPNEVTIQDFYL